VTNRLARGFGIVDARGPRSVIALVLGTALWSAALTGFVHALSLPDVNAQRPRPLAPDVRIVQIATPRPPVTPVAPKTPAAPVPQHVATHARPSAAPLHTTVPVPPRDDPPQPARQSALPAPPSSTPAPAASANGADTSTRHDAAAAPAAGNAGTAPGSGDGPARAISQPLPELSEDLREDAYRAIATARFAIYTDGSVSVQLVRPTQYPRLNALLMEALKKWRFAPATQNGQPIDSEQDIRVHFNVD
jgi:protein TonB